MLFPVAVAAVIAFAPVQAEQLIGRWDGVLAMPRGQSLGVVIRISRDESGRIVALADAPMFNDMDRAVTGLSLEGDRVRFEVSGKGRYEGRLAGDTIVGEFIEGDDRMPLVLTRKPA